MGDRLEGHVLPERITVGDRRVSRATLHVWMRDGRKLELPRSSIEAAAETAWARYRGDDVEDLKVVDFESGRAVDIGWTF